MSSLENCYLSAFMQKFILHRYSHAPLHLHHYLEVNHHFLNQFDPKALHHLVGYTFQKHILAVVEDCLAFPVHVDLLQLAEFSMFFSESFLNFSLG